LYLVSFYSPLDIDHTLDFHNGVTKRRMLQRKLLIDALTVKNVSRNECQPIAETLSRGNWGESELKATKLEEKVIDCGFLSGNFLPELASKVFSLRNG
jgi:hypothetical protein